MNKHAQALGKLGGSKKSVQKTESSRINGRLGGRPKDNPNAPDKYNTVHIWLKRNCEKNTHCKLCSQEKTLQFALKKGLEHKKDLTHYLMLCAKCHNHYDRDKLTENELKLLL
jgi:hypothetical protein